jgi:hypothetical protein
MIILNRFEKCRNVDLSVISANFAPGASIVARRINRASATEHDRQSGAPAGLRITGKSRQITGLRHATVARLYSRKLILLDAIVDQMESIQ